MSKIRLCFSPTTMQGDIYALVHYYQKLVSSNSDDLDLVICVDQLEAYRREPIWQLLPFDVTMWERGERRNLKRIKKFDPHFLFVDNHLPKKNVFRNLIYLWHGFGWKEHRAEIEFRTVHRELGSLVGGVKQSNPDFIHQCYGAADFEQRVEHTHFHAHNCRVMGMLYADLLQNPPVSRDDIAQFYPFKETNRKVVLLGFTWVFGEIFANWAAEENELMQKLFEFLAEREINVIFRLHDRKRYDSSYLELLESLAARYGNVLLKYKDVGRDNLLDILLSDIIISNFSSMIVYGYFTGAASIHIHPLGESNGEQPLYRFKNKKAVLDTGASFMWKMPPEENGGFLARNQYQLFEALETALEQPDCCKEKSTAFIAKYLETSTGNCCQQLDAYLRAWYTQGQKP